MTKKWVPAVIVIALVIVGGFLATRKTSAPAQVEENNTQKSTLPKIVEQMDKPATGVTTQETPTAPVINNSAGQLSGEDQPEGTDVQVFNVVFDGTSFSPKSLDVKLGDVVIFKNKSQVGFWPASGPHPQHTAYPEFDAKQAIAAGKSYQFKFAKVGNWNYHDHLHAFATGVVNVTK